MRRRVALLMTLACDPRILLLDEPFGALDTHTRTLLHKELIEIWRKMRQTVVLVTHDLDEAVMLSDRVIVLSRAAEPMRCSTTASRSRIRATSSRVRDTPRVPAPLPDDLERPGRGVPRSPTSRRARRREGTDHARSAPGA